MNAQMRTHIKKGIFSMKSYILQCDAKKNVLSQKIDILQREIMKENDLIWCMTDTITCCQEEALQSKSDLDNLFGSFASTMISIENMEAMIDLDIQRWSTLFITQSTIKELNMSVDNKKTKIKYLLSIIEDVATHKLNCEERLKKLQNFCGQH